MEVEYKTSDVSSEDIEKLRLEIKDGCDRVVKAILALQGL